MDAEEANVRDDWSIITNIHEEATLIVVSNRGLIAYVNPRRGRVSFKVLLCLEKDGFLNVIDDYF